jgi:hypothetical protein
MLSHASIPVQPASYADCGVVSSGETVLFESNPNALDVLSWSMLRSPPPQHVFLESTHPKTCHAIPGADVEIY